MGKPKLQIQKCLYIGKSLQNNYINPIYCKKIFNSTHFVMIKGNNYKYTYCKCQICIFRFMKNCYSIHNIYI